MNPSPANPSLAQIDHAHGHDQSGHVKTYWKVFTSLAIFTAIEYFYAHLFKDAFVVLVLGLMTWAIIKAALVGLYFMHLKYEGRWVFAMLIPSGLLGVVLVCALMPDIAMQPVVEMNNVDDDEVESAPAVRNPVTPANSTHPMTKPATTGSSH
jgi:cytochrome c oxidase subunit 4